MQIGAGASAGRPVGAGRLAGGDPATSGALRYTRGGRRGKTLPAEPLPPLPPPGRRRDSARPLFRRGLGRGGRIRARAFRPQGPPAPSAGPAARRWFSAPEGQAPALLYNNRALRAGSVPARRRGPQRATPPSGPRPARPTPRRPGWTQRGSLARTSPVTCWCCRAAETFPGTPSPPWEQGAPAGTPPRLSPTPGRVGTPEAHFRPPTRPRVAHRPQPAEAGGGGDRCWQGAQSAGAAGARSCPATRRGLLG